jgi:Fe2+ or Zn2+ uptake regulation protein
MGELKRLPVHHPQKPHCTCGRILPVFDGAAVVLPGSAEDHADFTILDITLVIKGRCKCGRLVNMHKDGIE